MNTVVVVGFGSFGDVHNNPSAAIAEALDGCVLNGICVVGREMPVSHDRSLAVSEFLIARTDAVAVIGIGVAMERTAVTVERTGRRPTRSDCLDVDHRGAPEGLAAGPEVVQSSMDCERLANVLGAEVGDDAGAYVCNSWLYQAIRRFEIDVGFIHVPPLGLDSGRLLSAIAELWGEPRGG